MADLNNPKVIYFKGLLFFGVGICGAALILLKTPTFLDACVLLATIWAWCRAYYFMFYVVQHYVDDKFRYAGIFDFVWSHITKRVQHRRP